MRELYRRRVGTARPSHLMFTSGVGSLIDLPNFSVLVSGLDDWSYHAIPESLPIAEPRLLSAVQKVLHKSVKELKQAPWMPSSNHGGKGEDPALRVGVPVAPFPGWLRCTACNELAPIESAAFKFENVNVHRPHDARFAHTDCGRKKKGRRPLAVSARFVLACSAGHLDDFPYVPFVHRGAPCEKAPLPRMRMDDRGGNLGANVKIQCVSCGQSRNIREALGKRGEQNLPRCRARHPHLATFGPEPCKELAKVLVVGASNQWFAQTLAALAVPRTGAGELAAKVEQQWEILQEIGDSSEVPISRKFSPALKQFASWSNEELWAAIQQHRAALIDGEEPSDSYPDLRTPEWDIFSAGHLPEVSEDFSLRRDPDGVPERLRGCYADVLQAERLREVRALIGFTRLDAPDPEDPTLVTRVELARDAPTWVPASEVRGEGIFLRVPEELLAGWEQRVSDSDAVAAHREAYARFTQNRFSDRISGPFDPMRNWPGPRYIALHTLSHLLLRTIALECGYNAASLSERVYASTNDDPRGGILIYTAVPDAEGTLGGLVSLAEPTSLIRLTQRALSDARHCSSDPLCAERLPHAPSDFLHGAACHVCLFVSETTCERGNRFLDRRFVVPIGDPTLALFPEPV
jgi:hypothetical protein